MSEETKKTETVFDDKYSKLSPEDVLKISREIMGGEIFIDRYIKEQDFDKMGMIFLPLAMSTPLDIQRMQENPPAMVYAYNSNAMPRSINGYPIFSEIHFVWSVDDVKLIFEQCERIKEVMNGEATSPDQKIN